MKELNDLFDPPPKKKGMPTPSDRWPDDRDLYNKFMGEAVRYAFPGSLEWRDQVERAMLREFGGKRIKVLDSEFHSYPIYMKRLDAEGKKITDSQIVHRWLLKIELDERRKLPTPVPTRWQALLIFLRLRKPYPEDVPPRGTKYYIIGKAQADIFKKLQEKF